jgi:ubiquinone/menaquinone biosynthesis C-methylase UbiE
LLAVSIQAAKKGGLAAAAAAITAAGGLWWRKHPTPCPYGQRFWIEAPHPLITKAKLCEALEPKEGETVLEVGPGTGYYTLEVARALQPGGSLHILDIQPKMLDHVTDRAANAGVVGIQARLGDARILPYDNNTFDKAYLVTVLGEIPDQRRALAELHRVLRPKGRLVVGELAGDPHMVSASQLAKHAAALDYSFERRIGPRFGYFASLGVEKPALGA